MLRVIAGEYGSRQLKSLDSNDTRPTLEKTKGAIFNKLGPFFDGGTFLDLFGGSGSIGIEALSRGVDKAVFVEKSPKAAHIIKENLKMLGCTDRSEVHICSYKSYLAQTEEKFDCVYVDPPYALKDSYAEIMQMLSERDLLQKGAYVVLESSKELEFNFELPGLIKEKDVIYGISRITYYHREDL